MLTYSMKTAWTPHDDAVCIKAEDSGMAVLAKSGEPLTLEQLDQLAEQYDKVRNTMSTEDFFNKHLTTKAFGF